MTYDEVVTILKSTRGNSIVERMRAIHGHKLTTAFQGGDWRNVSFVGQDMTGISLKYCNLKNSIWDASSNIAGCELVGSLIDRGLRQAGGFADAIFDEKQQSLIASWENRPITPAQYAQLIRQAEEFYEARDILRQMEAAGFVPGPSLYAMTIGKRRPSDHGDDPIEALAEPLMSTGRANRVLVNSVIGNSFLLETARRWFSRLDEIGAEPDIFSYNGLLRMLSHDDGILVVREMQRAGIKPDIYSFRSLRKSAPNSSASLGVIALLRAANEEVTIDEYHQAFWRAKDAGDVAMIRSAMAEVGVLMDRESWNRAIQSAADHQTSESLWHEMAAAGHDPDWLTVKAVMRHTSSLSQWREALALCSTAPGVMPKKYLLDALCAVDPSGALQAIRDRAERDGSPNFVVLRKVVEAAFSDGAELFQQYFH